MKKIFSILLSMTLVLSLAGCGSSVSSSNDSGNDTYAEDASAGDEDDTYVEDDSVEDEDDGIYAERGYAEGEMGDVMHTYFFDYTVNSAYTCTEYEGYVPEEGKELLVAEVTVKNTTRDEIEMYDTDFQVQWGSDGEDDYDYPITLYVEPVSDDQLPGEYDLEAGETRTGLLVYEVPMDVEEYSISYLEEFSDNTEGDTFFVYFEATEE